MNTKELHCPVKIVSRGKGRSAVGAAAYRSGEKLKNEYDGMTHDYTKKGGVVCSEIMLCENAPQEYNDRAKLWNAVEQVEKARNAQLSREYEIALPVELKREEQIQLVRAFVQDNFVNKGMCADFSIHDKGDGNPHVHIMLTMRPIEKDGTWGAKSKKVYEYDKNGERIYDKKKRQYKCTKENTTNWDSTEFLVNCRKDMADRMNREYERKNLPYRVEYRSFEERGIDKMPTQHLGKTATQMERRGVDSDRGNLNREIKGLNEEIRKTTSELNVVIARIQEDNTWNRIHETSEKLLEKSIEDPMNELVQRRILDDLMRLDEVARTLCIESDHHKDDHYIVSGKGMISYRQYHTEKVKEDTVGNRAIIENNLAEIERRGQPEHSFKVQDVKKQDAGKVTLGNSRADLPRGESKTVAREKVAFDVAAVTHQLEVHRAEFKKATLQTENRTEYRENPIYRQQAAQIAECTNTIKDQTASVEQLKSELAGKGLFQGREKKVLKAKIDNFEKLRREQEQCLKEMGVSDPSRAEEAIKEKIAQAEQEKEKAQAARENVGAAGRVAKAKAAFLDIAQTVPESDRRDVLMKMKNVTAQGENGMHAYKAEIAAQKELDIALRPQQQQERKQTHERSRWHDK